MYMENIKLKAKQFLYDFKGDNYISGVGVFNRIGKEASKLGRKVSVIVDGLGQDWTAPLVDELRKNLTEAGLEAAGDYIPGAKPNAPREEVFAIAEKIKEQAPDLVLSVGGGSTTDAVKAAIALNCLGDKYPDIDAYFGAGEITKMLSAEYRMLLPHYAVMTVSSSAAHLTKYSNITDIRRAQKMLIVDESVVPAKAMFDYTFSMTQPKSLTMDGALDGISHGLEVLMGIPEALYEKAKPVCLTCIELIVNNIKKVLDNPNDISAREAIGLATDLGGYSIMIGGTNGAHLNSFSMTDILSHGRACALMNPYYVVFFSTSISERLKEVGNIYKKAGYIEEDIDKLSGRDLGLSVAKGMIKLSKDIGFPTTLKEVPGYTEAHKIKCLEAAKDPKLESKLKNMPVPMQSTDVDIYMKPILEAAESGDMTKIKNLI
jgi:Alcohol dehydrogenase, class IV